MSVTGFADFHGVLSEELERIARESLGRKPVRIEAIHGPEIQTAQGALINFGSNDYLGLSQHLMVKEAAARALHDFGAGSGSARLIAGSTRHHQELEERLAEFKNTEAALVYGSGYLAALGTIPSLVGPGDLVLVDRLAHACLIDAVRLSRAKLWVYKHNQLDDLERLLKRARGQAGAAHRRLLIVTETLFSMDGDFAPISTVVELKERYGAWLMVDEAHATGLYGPGGGGLVGEAGLSERVEVQMGTLGKALGACGGYISGSRILVDYLINRARTFIFSTALPPAVPAAAMAAIDLAAGSEGQSRRETLLERISQFKGRAVSGDPVGTNVPARLSAILPCVVGGEERALACARRLRENGFYVPAIRYPSVGRGLARLRITLTATHTEEQVTNFRAALEDALTESPGKTSAGGGFRA